MFLIGSILVCFFSVHAHCDTVIDVFDESLESQLMQDDASVVSISVLGYHSDVESDASLNKSQPELKKSRPEFFLASSRKRITKLSAPEFWSAGKYPSGLLGNKSIITTTEDEHFFYFASDLEEQITEIQGFYFSVPSIPENRISSDQHLEKTPAALKR